MQESKKLFNFLHKTNFNAKLQESNSINLANIICSTSVNINIYIYIYIYKQRPHVGKYEVLSSGTLYNIVLIQASTLSKFSIYVKLLCNGKCIYSNVLIKFKEFVYIYNFTCFELIRMDLKSHDRQESKKIFYFLHKSNCNVEFQESNSMN